MNVEVKELEYCKLEVLYTADASVVKSKMDDVVAEFRDAKIPGFRRGKAPDSVIKIKLKDKINLFIAEQMKAQAYDDVVFKTEAKPIGYPQFDDVSLNGNEFSCKLTFIKKPDFTLVPYLYEIPRPDVSRDVDAEVNSTLEDLRLRLGDVQPYQENDFVDQGDQLTLDFNGTINGESFEEGIGEGQLYVVGQNKFPEFDNNLLGMAAGETREFDVTFPDGFYDLTGKTAHFTVTLHMGTKKVPCALDDALAQQCGSPTLEELRVKLVKIAEAKISQAESLKVRTQIMNRLVEDNDFKTPDVINTMEAQFIAMQNGIQWDQLEQNEKNILLERAEKQVKLSFILDSIREAEPDSVLSDMEAQQGIIKRASLQGYDPEKFVVEAQKKGSFMGMISSLKDEFTIQWLVDKTVLVD